MINRFFNNSLNNFSLLFYYSRKDDSEIRRPVFFDILDKEIYRKYKYSGKKKISHFRSMKLNCLPFKWISHEKKCRHIIINNSVWKNWAFFNYLIFSLYGRPGLVVTKGKLSQWLYWEKNLLEHSNGHILDVSVNANSSCVQCSVMASAALTRYRVLHYIPCQVKFYSLSFHVIDIERLFQCNQLLYYLDRCPFTEYVS